MSALGELMVFMFYIVLGLSALVCLLMTIFSRTKFRKSLYLIGFVCSAFLFLLYFNFKSNDHRDSELEYVGNYNLINYPNCESCKVFLQENNTYEVRKGNEVIEKGNWHYKSGSDYWIVYMGKDKEQLGNGRFAYEEYNNRYKDSRKNRGN